jgi:hypothetical protein
MIVLVVTCAEVSILLCYFQVCTRVMRLLRVSAATSDQAQRV